ncbi:hypothetical protein AcW1_001090 [Taiwanofungus camphoratus]|nr:hypothetical protein AcW1_001090 [Antrodia cinnamomea]
MNGLVRLQEAASWNMLLARVFRVVYLALLPVADSKQKQASTSFLDCHHQTCVPSQQSSPTATMSSREPLWYCHECHAEMRPLMVPDPHCASCNGTFVEKMENPADDPREFQHAHGGFDDGEFPADMDGFLALRTLLRDRPNASSGTSTRPFRRPASPRPRSEGPPSGRDRTVDGTGFTIRIQGSPDGRARTIIMGNSPRHGGPDDVPMFPQFMSGNTDTRPDGHVINGPLMAQYLLAMLANRPGRGDPFHEIFGGMLGPEGGESGRWGDYVFNQEALDQIITQIMENSNSTAPVPASGEVMENLPRDVLEEGSPLLQKDCAVCKEQFKLETDDPDEQVVVTLPCKHPFHESCIMPWLKSSGTCPVCR